MALNKTRPFAWSEQIIEARAWARASATFLFGSPLLTQPLVIRPRRISMFLTVVRCQLPPRAVGPSSVQLVGKRPLRNEADRYEFPNGRGQSSRALLCGPLVF
jgi:hypothetical protein